MSRKTLKELLSAFVSGTPKADDGTASASPFVEAISIHITKENALTVIDKLFDAIREAGSVLASGLADRISEIELRDQSRVFDELNAEVSAKGLEIAESVAEMPVGFALLSVLAAVGAVLDAYKRAANEHIDKQKDAAGRYPCGHTDDQHTAMDTDEIALSVSATAGGMRGNKLDQ